MNSAVYYKFKSQKAESRIPIDGTGISVFDLKREIILANGLDKALDIDLQVFNQLGDEGLSRYSHPLCRLIHRPEYKDDYLVPRSSSVVVKRIPLIRGARSRFGRYLAGAGPRPSTASALTQHNKPPAPAPIWTRGTSAFSKRFDGKEDPKISTSTATVSIFVHPWVLKIELFPPSFGTSFF